MTPIRPPLPADVLKLVSSRSEPKPGAEPEVLNDSWHTAIHEAGHAVMGRVLGIGMGQASMAPDKNTGRDIVEEPRDTLRRWRMYGRPNRDFRSVFRARVMTLMAGIEAERAILGSSQEGDGRHADESDYREIHREMEHHPGNEAEIAMYLASLCRAAGRLVRRHRADIEFVAAELQARDAVSGFELDAMVFDLPEPLFEPSPQWWDAFNRRDEACPADAPEIPSSEMSILRHLAARTHASAVEIGKACAMAPAEIRARLTVLEGMWFVTHWGEKPGASVAKPQRIYALTGKGRYAAEPLFSMRSRLLTLMLARCRVLGS